MLPLGSNANLTRTRARYAARDKLTFARVSPHAAEIHFEDGTGLFGKSSWVHHVSRSLDVPVLPREALLRLCPPPRPFGCESRSSCMMYCSTAVRGFFLVPRLWPGGPTNVKWILKGGALLTKTTKEHKRKIEGERDGRVTILDRLGKIHALHARLRIYGPVYWLPLGDVE